MAELLRCVDERAKILKSSFQEIYAISLEHVDKWFHIENHQTQTNWTLLREQKVRYAEVMDLAKQLHPQTAMIDELFDEVSTFNVLLKKIPLDVFRKEKVEKWMNIFARNDSFPLLYKLISIVFSSPVCNAFVEVYSSLFQHSGPKRKNAFLRRQSSPFYK